MGRTTVSPVPSGVPLCSQAYVTVVVSLSGSFALAEHVTTSPDSRPVLGEMLGISTTGARLDRVMFVDCEALVLPSEPVAVQVIVDRGGRVPFSDTESFVLKMVLPSDQE